MNRKKRYGVWNTKKKEFQFGICEPSKTKARKKLFEKILERLEELQNNLLSQTEGEINLQVGVINGVMYSGKIVQEVAEEYMAAGLLAVRGCRKSMEII